MKSASRPRIGGKFKFKPKLEEGSFGEQKIIKAWPNNFIRYTDGREHDLIVLPRNSSVEVKTETYWTLDSSSNFFMERFSKDTTFDSGGPWRAYEDSVEIFISFFIQNGVLFWFEDLEKLIYKIEDYVKKYNKRPSSIPNFGYNTIGWAIPRHYLEDCYVRLELGQRTNLFNIKGEKQNECE